MAQAGAQAQGRTTRRRLAQLRDNTEQATKLLGQVQEANEAAWKDMQAASEKALAQLQQGWADALKRFAVDGRATADDRQHDAGRPLAVGRGADR